MHVVKFPETEKAAYLTASDWLRKVADMIEADHGKEVFLSVGVVTFDATDGSGFFYNTPGDEPRVLAEIGILELAKNHLIRTATEPE